MAGSFDNASSQYLEATSGAVSALPCTLACWFNSDDTTINQTLVSVSLSSVTNRSVALEASGAVASDPVRAKANAAGTAVAVTSAGYTANTWTHAAGVFTNATSRDAYINGGNSGNNTVSATAISSTDRTEIGKLLTSSGSSQYMSGRIAEVGIWNVALTAAEIASLAAGYSPLFVRPSALVFYAPLVRNFIDRKGGLALSDGGSGVTVGDHCRVLWPTGEPARRFTTAAGGGGSVIVPYYFRLIGAAA